MNEKGHTARGRAHHVFCMSSTTQTKPTPTAEGVRRGDTVVGDAVVLLHCKLGMTIFDWFIVTLGGDWCNPVRGLGGWVLSESFYY